MKVIHHYPVPAYTPGLGNRLLVPLDTQILGAQLRDGQPTLYVEKTVGQSDTRTMTCFFIGTGHPFDDFVPGLGLVSYVGTVQDGPFFWHIYAGLFQ